MTKITNWIGLPLPSFAPLAVAFLTAVGGAVGNAAVGAGVDTAGARVGEGVVGIFRNIVPPPARLDC